MTLLYSYSLCVHINNVSKCRSSQPTTSDPKPLSETFFVKHWSLLMQGL